MVAKNLKHIKPKQVGEQHKMLSSPEHNFRPKKIMVRVHELEEELAEQERLAYLRSKEEEYDKG